MKTSAAIAVLALGWLSAGADKASAAWNNVFQPTCNNCKTRSSYFAPQASACCPTVTYQQRCCYTPYTAYRQETYCEPVTSYQTSYYWEPVTSYRYTSYYDPCTGCCQQVCTPTTSYRLRSQCNAVQSYVQRCRMVPYTAYRQSCYLEPVVTYSAPACPAPCASPSPSAGITEQPGTLPPQNIPDPNRKPLPGVSEDNGKNLPPQNLPNTNYRRGPGSNELPLRMDRITSNSNGHLQGTLVADDRMTPRGATRIHFANAAKPGEAYSVQTDVNGRFQVELPAGDWTLHLPDQSGKSTFHSQITVRNSDRRSVMVVSR